MKNLKLLAVFKSFFVFFKSKLCCLDLCLHIVSGEYPVFAICDDTYHLVLFLFDAVGSQLLDLLLQVGLDVHYLVVSMVLSVLKRTLHQFFHLNYANRIAVLTFDQLEIWPKRLVLHFARLATACWTRL